MEYEQDYILRLIQRVGVFFREIISALREHRPKDALRFSQDALHHITGLSSDAAETMPAETLVVVLSAGGQLDVRRALILAEVFARRSEAFDMAGEGARSDGERSKARTLARAALATADGEDADRARSLLAEIERDEQPPPAGTKEAIR